MDPDPLILLLKGNSQFYIIYESIWRGTTSLITMSTLDLVKWPSLFPSAELWVEVSAQQPVNLT